MRNLRYTVRFAQSVQMLLEKGYRTFVEMSPHPVLSKAVEDTMNFHELSGNVLPTTRRASQSGSCPFQRLSRKRITIIARASLV